eukprot:jgi/Mesen1/797/ME000110S_11061
MGPVSGIVCKAHRKNDCICLDKKGQYVAPWRQAGIVEVVYFTHKGVPALAAGTSASASASARPAAPSASQHTTQRQQQQQQEVDNSAQDVSYAASQKLLALAGIRVWQHRPLRSSITLEFK